MDLYNLKKTILPTAIRGNQNKSNNTIKEKGYALCTLRYT